MRHLGLDLSLRAAGIVVYDPDVGKSVSDHILHREVCGYNLGKKDSERVHLGRMLSIASTICRVAREFDPGMVTVEGPAFGASSQLVYLGGLAYTVKGQLKLARGLDCLTVPPLTSRKALFGRAMKPKAFVGDTKKWVAEQLNEKYEVDLGDGDLNDALVQCLYRVQHESAGGDA